MLAYDILAGIAHDAPEAIEGSPIGWWNAIAHRRAEALAAMTEAGLGDRVLISDPFDPLPRFTGVLLGNEVADAFPAHRLIVRDGELRERFVTTTGTRDSAGSEGERSEESRVTTGDRGDRATLPDGAILDVCSGRGGLVRTAASLLERGLALIIDYGYPAEELYSGTGWRAHCARTAASR